MALPQIRVATDTYIMKVKYETLHFKTKGQVSELS